MYAEGSEAKYYGFCLYISFYYMTDVDDYEVINVIITLKELVNLCIEEYF